MLTRRREKLAIIHIAKKRLGLSDKAYRAMLLESSGVRSAADLKNDTQYFALMRALRAAGFQPEHQEHGCTKAQRCYIEGLWQLASRSKTERSLRAMIMRICGIEHPRFLTKAAATKVILALRDIAEKAGFNPDKPDTESAHGSV